MSNLKATTVSTFPMANPLATGPLLSTKFTCALIVVGDNDDIYCWDSTNFVIRKITNTTVSLFAGTGSSGTLYSFDNVRGLLWYNSALYVLSYFAGGGYSYFLQIHPDGTINSTILGSTYQYVYSPVWNEQYGCVLVILGGSMRLGSYDPANSKILL